MPFQKAIKETFSLKLAIAGISGVGKSFTSFQVARELADGERFAVIDSENRKARKYADEFHFDVSDLTDNFSLAAYTKEIRLAESLGYKVLVIDGLSQMWEGKGGIKEQVEMIAKRDRISTFTAWQAGNGLLADFMKLILDSKMHIICTLRSKTDYSSGQSADGKTQYKRIGLAPVQKDNLEFEFDIFTEMDTDHHMIFQKSLCRPLSGKVLAMANEGEARKLAAILKKWMVGAPNHPEADTTTGAQEPEQTPENSSNEPVTEQQWASIRKMCQHLGKAEPQQTDIVNHVAAKDLIAQLSQEYKQSRSKAQ